MTDIQMQFLPIFLWNLLKIKAISANPLVRESVDNSSKENIYRTKAS